MSEALPARVGRYEIRRELGRGMMGVVYEAHDPALGRPIALKTIQLAFALSAEERESFERRFMAEARIAAALSHPGIVIVHDVGRDVESGTLYIALERLQGQTLAQRIADKKPLDWREALRLGARVAEALHHAHSQGVVHRDIKPANIMILPSGEPKIMDFGIARAPTSQLTTAGQIFGTPSYMSPEQGRGGPLDQRSDLFSLGAVLYQLVTGQRAFPGEALTDVLSRVIFKDPPPPSHVVRSLPREVDYLVMRALAKAPADRYPDGKTLAEDIEDALAGRPPRHRSSWTAPPPADGTVVSRGLAPEPPEVELSLESVVEEEAAPEARASRLRTAVPLVVVAALAALTISYGVFLRPQPKAPSVEPTVGPTEEAELPPLPPLPAEAQGEPPAASPEAVESEPATASPETVEPDSEATSSPETAEPESEPEPSPQPSPTPTPEPRRAAKPKAAPAPGRLAIDFEHGLKSGMLRIWVDEEQVLDQELDSRLTTKVLAFKLRKGAIKDVLEVKPGRHDVRVQLQWDDNDKQETISGTFKSGATRRLEIRLGRIRKNLSLDWR